MKIKTDLINVLSQVIDDKKYSNLALNKLFETNSYSNIEKGFINNMLNITLKNLIYIDYAIANMAKSPKRYIKHILRISIAQLLYTDADEKGVIYEAVELAKKQNEYQAKFVNATLRNFLNFKDQIYENASEDIRYSYPKWLYEKIRKQFGDEKYIEVLKSYKEKSHFSVRVNHNMISKEEFTKLLENLEINILFQIEDVYYLDSNKILKSKAYLEGYIHMQDASSYLAAMMLDVKKEDKVYDAACYPGGKALAILDKCNPRLLVGTDIHEHKVKKLKEIEKKHPNFKAYCFDASKFNEGLYDKILLDLPCSGIGVLRKKPEKIYNLKQSDIKEIKKLQKRIFENAYKLLKKGGEILYSTCTIIENENTNNAIYFLEKFKDLEVIELDFPTNVKIIKDKFKGNLISYENKYLDGFYIIKFRKK